MIYWISTTLIALFLLVSAYSYIFSQDAIEGVKNLGFPEFFIVQLAVLKFIAVFLLLIPIVPMYIKEWTYAGVGLFLITAIVAHMKHRDGIGIFAILIVLFVILSISRVYLHKVLN